jgi:hypothetical protein
VEFREVPLGAILFGFAGSGQAADPAALVTGEAQFETYVCAAALYELLCRDCAAVVAAAIAARAPASATTSAERAAAFRFLDPEASGGLLVRGLRRALLYGGLHLSHAAVRALVDAAANQHDYGDLDVIEYETLLGAECQ